MCLARCTARSAGEAADQEDKSLGEEVWAGSLCESLFHKHTNVPAHFLFVTIRPLCDASSVTSENIVPSGKVLALEKCATVLEGPSATSSCLSAYEPQHWFDSQRQLLKNLICGNLNYLLFSAVTVKYSKSLQAKKSCSV